MSRLFAAGIAAVALIATTTLATANGVTYDKLAYLTFSAPVQVPGATLGAGTYRFRLANPGDSRNVLQVLSRNGSIVYANFHTTPDSRTALTNEPIVTFRETPAGVPPAIRSLFYGGELSGYEFVYPKGGPNMIPEASPQPAVTYTPLPAAISEPVIEPAWVPTEARPITEPVEEFAEPVGGEPAEVPKTATPLPLVAIGGLASFVAGLGLGVIRRRRG